MAGTAGVPISLRAAGRLITPIPYALSSPGSPRSSAELRRAYLTSSLVREGSTPKRRAAAPETWGAEKEVPVN